MSYMQELDEWVARHVFDAVYDSFREGEDMDAVFQEIAKAIRNKVLESYRNGAKRCPNCHGEGRKPAQKPPRRRFGRERQ